MDNKTSEEENSCA